MEGDPTTPQAKDAMAEAQRNLVNGPPVGSRWRHFKGGVYRVLDNVVLEEDCDHLVVYQSEKTGNKVARRLAQFLDVHPMHKVKRFEQIG